MISNSVLAYLRFFNVFSVIKDTHMAMKKKNSSFSSRPETHKKKYSLHIKQ